MRLDQITETELTILQVLWDRGEATSREIAEAIYHEATDAKVSSVQKLIERLEAKGCIGRDRSERAHRFQALIDREAFLQQRLQAMADRLCDGSLTPLLTALVDAQRISKADRQKLRTLIEKLWPEEGTRK
jgi:BlaI family transcriptional regulator, penicillinase repressor